VRESIDQLEHGNPGRLPKTNLSEMAWPFSAANWVEAGSRNGTDGIGNSLPSSNSAATVAGLISSVGVMGAF
jgi:hypothetical protein